MKYFINKDNKKVGLAHITNSIFGDYALCWDLDGNEYALDLNNILDDGTPDFIEVSIPVKFPAGFVPTDEFDVKHCMWCPFYCAEEGVANYCGHKDYKTENRCPIKEFFN